MDSCNHHTLQEPDVCTSNLTADRTSSNRPRRSSGGIVNDDVEIVDLVEDIQELQVLNPQQVVGGSSTRDIAADATQSFQESGTGDADHVFATDDSTDERHGGSRAIRIRHSVVVICDLSKTLTPVGLVKSVILLSCVVGLGCLCATDYPALVVSAPARFHIFSLTFTLLTVFVVFLLEILTLLLLFPINWSRWNALVHAAVFLLLSGSSTLLVDALFANQTAMPRLDNTVEMIIISGISGYFGAALCLMTSAMACCCYDHHLTVPWKQPSDSLLLLK